MRLLAAVLLAFIVSLNAATTWICTWDANTESDLAGYIVIYQDSLGVIQEQDVKNVLEYRFVGGDSTCVFVKAYDFKGNISEPSETQCAKMAQNTFDLNGDGKVTGVDVIDLRLAIRRDDPDPKYDLNNDGKLTGADLIALRLYIKNN